MKAILISMTLLGVSWGAMSVTRHETDFYADAAKDYVSFKIKNDTGTDHRIISSSGGSVSLDASTSAHSISMKDGDDVFMYDKGTKGAKILKVEAGLKGKTLLLSDLLK